MESGCEMSDLIRRQDAIDAICHDWCLCNHSECKHIFDMKKDESYWCDGCTDVNVLIQLPTAQLERKAGHWEENKGQQILMSDAIKKGETWRVCSVCGAGYMVGHQYEYEIIYHNTYHNYCPNCGAKMEGIR